jgi:broad specificity phosphatase PhoE
VATILLARHGETDWNRERRWQGHTDRPLNEAGRAQARELAERLAAAPPAAIYSSDLARARETAEIVGERLGLAVAVDPRLREVDVGDWSGLTMADVEARFPEALQRRLAGGIGWEHGETYEEMGERVLAALREIAAVHDERVLVVTHGGSVRAVLHAAGVPAEERPHVRNCDVHEVVLEEDGLPRVG